MRCERVEIGGVTAFACMAGKRAPCAICGKASSKLCDGPPRPGARKKTCDKALCGACATSIGEDRDLCPDCVEDAARAAASPLTTTIEVWTARLDPRMKDPDLLDTTRLSGKADAGLPFAPTWAIVKPAINARHEAAALLRKGHAEGVPLCDQADADQAAHHLEAEAWRVYVPAYLAEMLVSSNSPVPEPYRVAVREAWERGVRPNPEAWARLLAKSRVVVACMCPDEEGLLHCHRFLLARILGKLGATLKGELPLPPSPQLSLMGEVVRG